MNRHYWVQKTILYRACLVCVCVTTTKYANIVLEQRMREIIGLMTEGGAGDGQNCTVRGCMVCTGE